MPTYLALLGHQPAVSLSEFASQVPGFTLKRRFGTKLPVVLFDVSDPISPHLLSILGGTILLAKQCSDAVLSLEDIPQLLSHELSDAKGKVTFGLRAVNVPRKEIKILYRRCKQHLKKQGRPSRYVGNERKPALPVVLHDHGLLNPKRGCEIAIIADEDGSLWCGRTIAAQDVKAYTFRDIEKPFRDIKVGFLPPKLAQILLNFGGWLVQDRGSGSGSEGGERLDAQSQKQRSSRTTASPDLRTRIPNPIVYDPFCGTGVIPMEAVIRGWPVMASDISLRAVNGCTKNLDWLRKKHAIQKKNVPSAVWKQDARKPFDFTVPKRYGIKGPPDVIVSETSLGPLLEKHAPIKEASKLKTENEKLQAAFLINCAHCLPQVPIVCTWPVWITKQGPVFLEKIWDTLEKLHYTPVLPWSADEATGNRPTLLYRRQDQYVGREIVLLRPKH